MNSTKDYYVNPHQSALFSKFKNPKATFIETGCHEGGGLIAAISAGFGKYYSCDIFDERVKTSSNKMDDLGVEYKIFNLNSVEFLTTKLPTFTPEDEFVFWLDAHGEGGGVPLTEELNLIKKYLDSNRKVIIVDDVPVYFDRTTLNNQLFNIDSDFIIEGGYDYNGYKDYTVVAYTK